MSLAAALDSIAGGIAGQYRLLLEAISGRFARALDSHDPTTPKARSDFHVGITQDVHTFLASVMGALNAHLEAMKNTAVAASGASLSTPDATMLSAHIAEIQDELQEILWSVMTRDQATTERELRKVALQVELLQAGTGISKVGALIRVKFGKVRKLRFVQEDRIGRKRASDEYVRSLVRQTLLTAYIESYLFALAKSGQDLVRVVYADGRDPWIMSIAGLTEGYPAYDDVRDEVFHPNSLASVERI